MSKDTEVDPNVLSRFLSTLYDMVFKNEFASIIQWNEAKQCIRISDRIAFINEVIPTYFKHQTYQSFTRQLNMYGFTKKHNTSREVVDFYHPHFQLHRPELLRQIKRKSSVAHYQATLQEYQQQHKDSCSSYIESIETKLHSISNRQYDIENHIRSLQQQYQQLEVESYFLRLLLQKYSKTTTEQIEAMGKACNYSLPRLPEAILKST